MGLCKQLNCCDRSKKSDAVSSEPKRPPDQVADDQDNRRSPQQPDKPNERSNGHLSAEVDGGDENKDQTKEPVYAVVQKRKQPQQPHPTAATPVKAGFLVSFVVDSRGGAMTGCRGSGLRIILPPGAVEQPVRVTCRFIRPQSHNVPFPPPIMERDALASGVIEVGPGGAKFRLPVLVEIPYFASLSQGERELVVLRSDDGETWREHDMEATFLDSNGGWSGEEGELYQDVVQSTHLKKVTEDLDTGRIVRLSTLSFPKYFVVLTRIKGEVESISPEGGCVQAAVSLNGKKKVSVTFPPNALKKKIKIGLQLQNVPASAVKIVDDQKGIVDVYPLMGIYPRRRKFHHPIEISIPVMSEDRSDQVRKIWILCSLSSATEKAVFEDVSDSAGVEVKGKRLVFETKVSALFWLITCKEDYAADHMLHIASCLYKELTGAPYIARLTAFHRPQFPFAWCDALRIYCAVNDRMDGYIEQKDDNWQKVLDGREVEVTDRSTYRFEMHPGGDLLLASDCQMEAKLDDRLVFKAFYENSLTLLVRRREEGKSIGTACLVMKQQSSLPGASRKDVYTHSSWMLEFKRSSAEVTKTEDACDAVLEEGAEIVNDDYETVTVKTEITGLKHNVNEPS